MHHPRPGAPRRPFGEGTAIATVRQVLLWAEVTTSLRPRTEVERWQIQDRLRSRLLQLGHAAPRFFESPGGTLAFRVRVGWRLAPEQRRQLAAIDDTPPGLTGVYS